MKIYRKEWKFAKDTAVATGDILLRGLKKKRKVHFKGQVDLVTQIDIKAEKFITSQIKKTFPKHSVLAEESGVTDNRSKFQWIIDPIDGTTNYAHGYPMFCVSIALAVDNKMVLGAIYDPIRDELFYAHREQGAFLNRTRIHVTDEKHLIHSLLATGFPYDIAKSRIDNLQNFGRMYKDSRGIRRGGSAALDLCYLACGRFDGFWELKLHPWDTAAGLVLVEEAGGKVTQIDGKKYSIYNKNILASNKHIHSQMKKVLSAKK
ncbi:MAG: inositol monophosphatase [candidate division Zixibacteria bacterium]|nr:inositol monophosphatase [candidate division Zixibacteria bacterium]